MNETAGRKTAAEARVLNHQRSLSEIVAEVKDEAAAFVNTRIRMIRAELHESLGAAKVGVPLVVLALGLFAIAALLFTGAAVVLVASAFAGNPYAWFFGFVIIGLLWAIFGAMAAYFARQQFRGTFPKRTLEVLKADKVWLQKEAKSHL